MTKDQLIALYIIIAALIIGLIIFFVSCIYIVKKDTVIIIEKVEKYYGKYEKGVYFFWPFVYRRRGTYPTNKTKKVIRLSNGKKAEVFFQIIDVLKYHYSNTSIESIFNKLIVLNEKVTLEILKKELDVIGVELFDIKQIIN